MGVKSTRDFIAQYMPEFNLLFVNRFMEGKVD